METMSAQEIWEATLGELQIQFNKSNYKTWLEKTVGLSCQDNQFIVGTPNIFVAEYLDKKQHSLIEKTLIGLTHRNMKVIFQVGTKIQSSPGDYTTSTTTAVFNPKYTFDTFIVGDCNRLAHAAALGAAGRSEHHYNPLFLYGKAGLGKTHLLHAIGHAALADNTRVIYVSGEQFTNEFVSSIRNRKTEEFRKKFRSVDMLLIDDIHFLSGKEQTEESFFHTFNELHNANRQIVLTCDRPPKSIPNLQERLSSRFEWGLVADIQPPNFETRLAILQAKIKSQEVDIAPDVLELIARQIQQNIRELEGSLNRVVAYAQLLRTLVTPEIASKALENISSKATKRAPRIPDLIIEAVASSFQLTPMDLIGRKRDKETALARRVAMYLTHQESNCSLTQIGEALGGRDHSAVSTACQKVSGEIETSPYLRRQIQDIKHRIHTKH